VKTRKAPYADTTVPPEKSREQITKLLRDYGAEAVSWTESFTSNVTELRFVLKTPDNRMVQVRIVPPSFSVDRRTWVPEKGHYETKPLPNWAQSYRLLYYFLKAKLESIAFGLRDIEEEFLSDILVRGPGGEATTIGEIVRPQLESGKLIPMLPAAKQQPTDASYSVVNP
jgi:hypothetical protein